MDIQRTRLGWVRLCVQTGDAGLVCRRCGIARPTLRKWWRRYQTAGEAGLFSRSCRPHHCRDRRSSPQRKRSSWSCAGPVSSASSACAARSCARKPTTYMINVARGEIIDEAALYDALAHRAIAGAVLDVWYRYPAEPGPTAPARRPFSRLPNLLMTPHVSGWTDGMLEARARLIAENIARVARGEPPLNRVA